MPEVDVKKQSSEQQRNASSQLERSRQSGELQHRGPHSSLFSLHPAALFSMSPFALMRRFTDEMDRVFEGQSRGRGFREEQWSPAVEVTERDGKLEVVADLPGIKESDVKKREGYYRTERRYGQFYRVIHLPEDANVDQARAEFHNGELRISIPVPEQQRRTRQIPIGTSGERKEAQSQTAAGASQGRRTG